MRLADTSSSHSVLLQFAVHAARACMIRQTRQTAVPSCLPHALLNDCSTMLESTVAVDGTLQQPTSRRWMLASCGVPAWLQPPFMSLSGF
jgi:hypothetical protein